MKRPAEFKLSAKSLLTWSAYLAIQATRYGIAIPVIAVAFIFKIFFTFLGMIGSASQARERNGETSESNSNTAGDYDFNFVRDPLGKFDEHQPYRNGDHDYPKNDLWS